MKAPLYKNNQMPDNNEVIGNKGLWFDRFYNQYDENNWKILKPKNNDENKGNSWWLNQCFHGKKVGDADQLTGHTLQQKSLVESQQGKSHIFSANWHMVTGMGNPHPVENGFAWHPTLGVPFLTGAAVKGIVRNYIENYLDDTEEARKALLFNWFGSTDKDPSTKGYDTQTGHLIFFDALPIEPVQLVVDIMTPHMGKWYQDGGDDKKANKPETIPADWHDPVPVTFLATNNISLQFSYALRQYPQNSTSNSVKREVIDLEDVKEVLTLALKHFGVGGKTATGYGAMSHDTQQEENLKNEAKALEKENALQNLSEAQLTLFELREMLQSDKDKNFKQAGCEASSNLANLLKTAEEWELEDRIEAVDLAEEVYSWHGWGPKKKLPLKKEQLEKLRQE